MGAGVSVSKPEMSGTSARAGTGDTPVIAQAQPKGLLARVVGVILSPRATYAEVASRPTWFGVLVFVFIVSTIGAAALLSTEVGRKAIVDVQITQSESYGRQMTQEQIDMLERMSSYYVYLAPVFQLFYYVAGTLVVSGLGFAAFSALLGGDARFKQVFAIVAHSSVVFALQQLFTQPLDYARQSLTSPTTLAVFLPFLDDGSFMASFFGAIDLFLIWWTINLAIGLGVLYRKRTQPIAVTLLLVYGAIAIVVATVKTALSGA
jgi:hypothetical protein